MQIEIKLNSFEGPLDLLLHLIDKNKVNIYDIPIAEITKQYMEYIDSLEVDDLDLMSDFLVMGATLIQIKVEMLLPPEVDEMGEEIDPREDLAERLVEYRMFKIAAAELKERENDEFFLHRREVPKEVETYQPPVELFSLLEDVSAEQLKKLYQDLVARSEERVDTVRSKFGTITKEKLRVSDKITAIMEYSRTRPVFAFRNVLNESSSRVDVVVTLLACLELIKMGYIFVSQEEAFGEIYMEWNVNQTAALDKEALAEYDKGL
ncbi:MAG: segregation and condensation protein A [Lachnospiraceae bacterium]